MKFSLYIVLFLIVTSCSANNEAGSKEDLSSQESKKEKDLSSYSRAYFASGCFWCVEAVFESIIGVEESISGYSGGKEKNPTYSEVSYGKTGHSESVEVYYDPNKVSYHTLVKVYYGSHNPVTVNGQAPDFGKQYRSMIFYQNDKEKEIAINYKDSLDNSGSFNEDIATEIVTFEIFYNAEDYHQNYEKNNPDQGYVKSVSVPRLNKFKAQFPELLKKGE
jgi:peptide-methionine (S)-S-oxide reductase